MNWTYWTEKIHKNAVEHGWWEIERNAAEIAALIHSEISEALEEYRADRPLEYYKCALSGEPCDMVAGCPDGYSGECAAGELESKPEGVAVELIDMVIRILDYFGWAGLTDVDGQMTGFVYEEFVYGEEVKAWPLPKLVTELHKDVSYAYERNELYLNFDMLGMAVDTVWQWLEARGAEPETLLAAKHNYNVTRSYRHGGKKL